MIFFITIITTVLLTDEYISDRELLTPLNEALEVNGQYPLPKREFSWPYLITDVYIFSYLVYLSLFLSSRCFGFDFAALEIINYIYVPYLEYFLNIPDDERVRMFNYPLRFDEPQDRYYPVWRSILALF